MADRNSQNGAALSSDQSRHKPVHMVEKRQLHKDIAINNFNPAATVRMIITQQAAACASGKGRCLAADAGILARHTHTASHTLCRTHIEQCSFQSRQIRRDILAIPIQNSDQRRAGLQQTCSERGGLAGAALMGKHAKLVNFSRCAAQLISCAVITAIINIDNFKRAALIDSDNFVNQRPYIALFIHHRHKNRNFW